MPKSLPRGVRGNNPGNIERTNPPTPWQGLAEVQTDDRFVTFADATWGIRALARTLITYQDKHGLRTVRQIVNRWAPPVENKTDSYVSHVASRMEVGPDDDLDVHLYSDMRPLVEAIIAHENAGYAYPRDVVDAGLLKAGIEAPKRALAAQPAVKAQTVAAAAGVAGMTIPVDTLVQLGQQVAPAWPAITELMETAPYVFGLIMLAGIGWTIWLQVRARRAGVQ